MYREHLRRVIGYLKRALRKEQRLTVEESNQLLQLSEAIIDYGRMIRAYHELSAPYVIIEITELERRFRETPQTIKDALLLLRDIGRAEPADLDGCWKLRLAGPLPSGREGLHSAPRHSHTQAGKQMRSPSDKKTSGNIEGPKRPYVRPQLSRLTLAEAKTKLLAEGIPGDAVGQEMLRRIEQLSEKN
jgi:hypothetical protein